MYEAFYFSLYQDPNYGLSALICKKDRFDLLTEENSPPETPEEEDELLGGELIAPLKDHGLFYSYNCVYLSEFNEKSSLTSLLKDLGMEEQDDIFHPEFVDFLLQSQIVAEKIKNPLSHIGKWFYFSAALVEDELEVAFALKPIWDNYRQITNISSVILSKYLKKLGLKEFSPNLYIYKDIKKTEELLKKLIENNFSANKEFQSFMEES